MVAARDGSDKVKTARKTKGVFVVHESWLHHCATHFVRAQENQFTLELVANLSKVPYSVRY